MLIFTLICQHQVSGHAYNLPEIFHPVKDQQKACEQGICIPPLARLILSLKAIG